LYGLKQDPKNDMRNLIALLLPMVLLLAKLIAFLQKRICLYMVAMPMFSTNEFDE